MLCLDITGCEREHSSENGIGTRTTSIPAIDDEIVTANVLGFVLDENNVPVTGAQVKSGLAVTITNPYGMFSLNKISLSKNNGSVTITKPGYFKGIRSFKTTAGVDHIVKIQLMKRTLTATIDAAGGGIVTANGGASVIFPANAFISANGSSYTGNVNIYCRWIDPAAYNLPFIMMGDLRGIATNGKENILLTYGMFGAEMEDATGNILSLANGKKATINFPIPSSLSAQAPASIQLWHFDDTIARWMEKSTAARKGNNYVAEVDKFSFWNCDQGISNYVNLDFTIINNATNTPMVGTSVRIKMISSGSYGNTLTNSEGFISGLVPKGEAFVLEVTDAECGLVMYSRTVGPFATNTSVGEIKVILQPTKYINISGRFTNCMNAPVTDGYITFSGSGGTGAFAKTNSNGEFAFTTLNCSGSTLAYNAMGIDNSTSMESNVVTGVALTPTVELGIIPICTSTTTGDIYIAGFATVNSTTPNNSVTYWKNGVATVLSDGTKNGLGYGMFVQGNDVYVAGQEDDNATGFNIARVWKNGVPTNLTDGTGYAQVKSIQISGTDIYVAGLNNGIPVLWKNGLRSNLPTIGTNFCVTIEGNDVYVAGEDNKILKNGNVIFTLAPTRNSFTSIFVSGTDVYLSGKVFNDTLYVATLWKNGVAISLSNGATNATANSVFISGSDVYVAGNVTNPIGFFTVAKLWKNGVETSLTNGQQFGNACCVVVKNNDVYVVGNDVLNATGTSAIILWKNGFPVNVTNGVLNAFPTSLFVN